MSFGLRPSRSGVYLASKYRMTPERSGHEDHAGAAVLRLIGAG